MVVRVPAEIVHQVAEYKKRKKPIIQLTKVAEDSCSEEDLMPQVVPGELEHLKQIAHGKESYFSISFCGDTGSGKTFLLAEILDFLKAEQQPLLVDGDMPEIAMTGDIECFIHKEKLFFDMEGPKGTIPLMQLIPEDALQEELQVQISDEEEKQRQRAVGKYFPRLALAFSHTFVYVTTQNPLRHQDACDELLDLAKALNPALTANAKPFLIIVWNQAELGKYVKKGQDGRLRDVELTEQLGNNEERKKMLELSFGRTQIITFPNKHISKRDLHGSELFDEKMAYFISLLEMHRFELNKMRLREGLELPARALLTIIPELVKQSVGGLIPSVPRALKEYMLQHPDEDQNVLKEVFLDLGRKSKVRCGKAEGALKEWRATSIRLSMLIAARNLAFRFLSEGVEAFPKEDQNARARSLYSKLLVYFKMVFCECQAKYPQSETDGGAPVYCKKEHHGHGSEHTTERPVSGILHLVLRSLFGPYHDSWKGEFELSEEDKKQLDEDLPAEMQQRTSTAALIWHRNNNENLEKHFKNFAQEGVSLLADYAERYSATSGDVPLRPNVAKRSRIDFHMDPLDPFCVACYQQVEGEVQTFVLCEGCYCAWSRRVTQLYKTVESGPQLYATGKDGFVYGQAVSDASADRNWRLRRIGLNLSGKILSVACSCEKTYVVLRPVASDKGTEILKPCLFQLDRSGDNPDVPILPPPSQEPARVALHRDMIYLVTQTGGLFSAPAPPTPVDWKPIYEPGFLKGSPWPIRSIAFHEDHVYILQGHLRAFKSTLYQVPVSNLSNIKAWKAVGDLEASTSVAAADDALFFTTSVAERAGGNIHRVPLPLDGKEIHLASQNLVSPHSSGFTSVAFVASGDEVRSFLEPIPSQDDWVLDEIEVNLEDDAAGTCVLDAPVAAVRGSAVSERFRGAWRSVIDAIHITYRGPDGQEIPAGSANAAQPGGTGEKP